MLQPNTKSLDDLMNPISNLRWTNLRSARNSHVFPRFFQDSWFYLKVEDQFTLHAVFDGHGQKGGGLSSGFQIWNPLDAGPSFSGLFQLAPAARSWRVSLCQGQLAEDHVGGLGLRNPTKNLRGTVKKKQLTLELEANFFQVAKCKL